MFMADIGTFPEHGRQTFASVEGQTHFEVVAVIAFDALKGVTASIPITSLAIVLHLLWRAIIYALTVDE